MIENPNNIFDRLPYGMATQTEPSEKPGKLLKLDVLHGLPVKPGNDEGARAHNFGIFPVNITRTQAYL